MKVLVINGSPAGKQSVTLQTVLYLRKHFKNAEFEILNAGQQIKMLEKKFACVPAAVRDADLILFAYPVYTFLVPSQLHRFIELLKENKVDLAGKYAAQISTSKHFFDVTAADFIEDNIFDLGMKYAGALMADMEDLLKEEGRKQAVQFFEKVLWKMELGYADPYLREKKAQETHAAQPMPPRQISGSKKVVIVTDCQSEKLQSMIDRFRSRLPYESDVFSIREFAFAGGCLGCFHCAKDGTCIYKDGFDACLREHIQDHDAIVYAFSIRDHSMGSRFKMYDDRQFCNGHRTVTMGKPVSYLIDGDLASEENLAVVLAARGSVGRNVFSFADNTGDVNAKVDELAETLIYDLEHDFSQPQNFYGAGGLRIFRDLIYKMQGLMKKDHEFYKEHGFYDFPQKDKGTLLAGYAISALVFNDRLNKKVSMRDGMLMSYQKVLKEK